MSQSSEKLRQSDAPYEVEAIFHALNHHPEKLDQDELKKHISSLRKNLDLIAPSNNKNSESWGDFFRVHREIINGNREKIAELLSIAETIRDQAFSQV